MITYVDTSALIKLLVDEPGSDESARAWLEAESVASVSLVVVEARAALAAARRQGRLTPAKHRRALSGFSSLVDQLALITVDGPLIDTASELAEAEALRSHDAVHLAAALFVDATIMLSADADLCRAGLRRGLHVANPVTPTTE